MCATQIQNDDFTSLLSDFDFSAPEFSKVDPDEIELIASKISKSDVLCDQINMLCDENTGLKSKLVTIQRTFSEIRALYELEKGGKEKLMREFNKLKNVTIVLERDKVDLQNELLNSDNISKQTVQFDSQRFTEIDDQFWGLCQTLKNNAMISGEVRKYINSIGKMLDSTRHDYMNIKNLEKHTRNVGTSTENKPRTSVNRGTTTSCFIQKRDYKDLKSSENYTRNVGTSTENKPRTTVNRGTSTSCFIQKHDVGTNFPDDNDILIEDVLKIMILPKILSPIHEPKVFMNFCHTGTQTKLKNVTKNIDYILNYDNSQLNSMKREPALLSNVMIDNNMLNSIGPPLNPTLSELWKVIGQMIFSTVGSGQVFENNSNMRDLTSQVARIAERIKDENEMLFRTTETNRKRRSSEPNVDEVIRKQQKHDEIVQHEDECDDLELLSASMQDEIYDIRLDPLIEEAEIIGRNIETQTIESAMEYSNNVPQKEILNEPVMESQLKEQLISSKPFASQVQSTSTKLDVGVLGVQTSDNFENNRNNFDSLANQGEFTKNVKERDMLSLGEHQLQSIHTDSISENSCELKVIDILDDPIKTPSRMKRNKKKLVKASSLFDQNETWTADKESDSQIVLPDTERLNILIDLKPKSFTKPESNHSRIKGTLEPAFYRLSHNMSNIRESISPRQVVKKALIENKKISEYKTEVIFTKGHLLNSFVSPQQEVTPISISKSENDLAPGVNLCHDLLKKSSLPKGNANYDVKVLCHKSEEFVVPEEISIVGQQIRQNIYSFKEFGESDSFVKNLNTINIEPSEVTRMNFEPQNDQDNSTESRCSSPNFLGFSDDEEELTESDEEILQILASYKSIELINPFISDSSNTVDSPAEPDDVVSFHPERVPSMVKPTTVNTDSPAEPDDVVSLHPERVLFMVEPRTVNTDSPAEPDDVVSLHPERVLFMVEPRTVNTDSPAEPDEIVPMHKYVQPKIIPTDRRLSRNMITQQASSPLKSIINNYRPCYRDIIMKRIMPPPSTPAENLVRRKIKDMLTNFAMNVEDALWTEGFLEKMRDNMYGLVKHNYQLLIKIILEYMETLNFKPDDINYEFTPPAIALPRSYQKIISLVEILFRNKSLVIQELERKLFSFNSRLHVHELSNLTYFYVGLADHNDEFVAKLRLFIYKCLYYYRFKAIPMVYIVLCSYPYYNIIPKNGDPIYAKNDPIINTIIAVLLNINDRNEKSFVQEIQEVKNTYKKDLLVNWLTKKLQYRLGECHMEQYVTQLFTQLQNKEHLAEIPYCFILISKRYGYRWSETNILQRHLWPYLNDLLKEVNNTKEYDAQIISCLYTISSILKICDNADDIVAPLNKLFCILSLTQKPNIQQSVIEAILRLSRFSYMEIYNRVVQWQTCSPINKRLLLMMKTFVYRKSLRFWKNV